jgi:hypothetical protein
MVPDREAIKNWVQTFRPTASATNKKLGGRVRTVWAPKNTERIRSDIGRSLKRLGHRHTVALEILSGSLQRVIHYIFTPTNYTLCKNYKTMILLQGVDFVTNLLL